MSYSCKIKTDSFINEDDINDIVEHLPNHLSSPVCNSKQMWGWSTGLDIWKPESNIITLGGSASISGDIAEEFVKYFEQQLKLKGYNILDKRWDY